MNIKDIRKKFKSTTVDGTKVKLTHYAANNIYCIRGYYIDKEQDIIGMSWTSEGKVNKSSESPLDLITKKPKDKLINMKQMKPGDIGIIVEVPGTFYTEYLHKYVIRNANTDTVEIMSLPIQPDFCWIETLPKDIKIKLLPNAELKVVDKETGDEI